jgi:CheY-like chemotaxis protein
VIAGPAPGRGAREQKFPQVLIDPADVVDTIRKTCRKRQTGCPTPCFPWARRAAKPVRRPGWRCQSSQDANFDLEEKMALKILTVDDSKTIRMIVKKAFRPYDCHLVEAENGQLGLEMAAKEKPDLIILDITMPVMTGVEMLEKLKEDPELKGIPVIMLTAESGKDNVMQIVKMGVQNYMVKPFKGEQLIERAQKVVEFKPKEGKQGSDPSAKYFRLDGDICILGLPAKITRPVGVEVETYLGAQLKKLNTEGLNKFVLDLSMVSETSMGLIKLIVTVTEKCQAAKIHTRVVGSEALSTELKEFAETGDIPIHPDLDQVMAGF